MPIPDPNKIKPNALDYVDPIGIFRCPHCAEVEAENKLLREELERVSVFLAVHNFGGYKIESKEDESCAKG